MLRVLWIRDRETVISGGAGVELWPRKLATARFLIEDMKIVKKAVPNAVCVCVCVFFIFIFKKRNEKSVPCSDYYLFFERDVVFYFRWGNFGDGFCLVESERIVHDSRHGLQLKTFL